MAEDIRFFRYPWELLAPSESRDETSGGHSWSSSGMLSVPSGSRVLFSQRIGHAEKLEEGLFSFPLSETGRPLEFEVQSPKSGERKRCFLKPPGIFSSLAPEKTFRDLPLYQLILRWSSFFDACLDTDEAVPTWDDIARLFLDFEGNTDDPRLSLIVRIANDLTSTLNETAGNVRSVLSRERRMVPAGRAEEFDAASIEWLHRQQGNTLAQKAAYNRQRLKSVTRKPFFDTLENRVLKDFLKRCETESRLYLDACTDTQRRSRHALVVERFERLCAELREKPIFSEISYVRWGALQPNYVLQSDSRYRKIWRHYCLLLRRQRSYDRLWAWQSRIWSDIAAVSLCVVIHRLVEKSGGDWDIVPAAQGNPSIAFEQHGGRRLESSSLPGPFLLKNRRSPSALSVLEVIRSEQIGEYLKYAPSDLQGIGEIKAAILLLITPLSGKNMRPTAVTCWPVHALPEEGFDAALIKQSMERAIRSLWDRHHLRILGIALVNTDKNSSELGPFDLSESGNAGVLLLDARTSGWRANISRLSKVIETVFRIVVK